jgi:hypothetical protein
MTIPGVAELLALTLGDIAAGQLSSITHESAWNTGAASTTPSSSASSQD